MKQQGNWHQNFNQTYKGILTPKIAERIGELPPRLSNAFYKVYAKRLSRNHYYEDDMSGMLEFLKNVICHCNDETKRDDKLSMREVEEAVSFSFPEIWLFITNYCLVNNIPITELVDNKKVEDNALYSNLCCGTDGDGKTCNYCDQSDDDIWDM